MGRHFRHRPAMTETSSVIVRFAPSPTGYLHVGNIRTALFNYLFARQKGGKFLLRLDDTDKERSKPEYVEGIRRDLAWLGFTVDGEFRQSDRFARYDAVMAELEAKGRVYPCYETPEELDIKRKVQLSRGLPPVYDRAALQLTAADRAALEAQGKRPHWRFKLDTAAMEWDDLVRGRCHFEPSSLSDPVVRRADGSYLYLLPSVIDDADYAITHVVRGEDHVTNSAVQTQMFEAMGAGVPAFAHVALLSSTDGELSKRLGSAGVAHYTALGVEPIALIAKLARLGASDPVEPFTSIEPLIQSFDFGKFGRATARFDEAELLLLNAKIVHQLGFEAVKDHLPEGVTPDIWEAVRPNVKSVKDAADWVRLIKGPVAGVIEDREYVAAAKAALAGLAWGADVWQVWTSALKEQTGRKGKELFMPLRLALTGQPHGPEMAVLLPLIGRDEALARLSQ
jgi:glutamyl-tRNA synthetase